MNYTDGMGCGEGVPIPEIARSTMPYYRVPLNVIMFAAGGLLGLLVLLGLLGLQVLRHKKYVEEVMEHHKKYVEEVNKKVNNLGLFLTWIVFLGAC